MVSIKSHHTQFGGIVNEQFRDTSISIGRQIMKVLNNKPCDHDDHDNDSE